MYRSCFIEEQAILTPREFDVASVDIDGYLAMQLKKKMEGKCSPQGFVRENSLQLLSRSLGQTKAGTFTGDFLFRCKLRCEVLYPAVGDFVDVDVLKINKMGAYAAFEDSLRVLMPRDLHIGSVEFDDLSVGDRIRIKILKTRFQSHDAFIMAVGTFEEIIGKQVPSIDTTVEKLDKKITNNIKTASSDSQAASSDSAVTSNDISAPILEQ